MFIFNILKKTNIKNMKYEKRNMHVLQSLKKISIFQNINTKLKGNVFSIQTFSFIL